MYAHRWLGMIAGHFLRKTLGNNSLNNKFDISINWIGIRFGLDKNQIVLESVCWLNPPRFTHNKNFLEIGEIAITLNLYSLWKLWNHKEEDGYEWSYIQVEDIMIEHFHINLEKTDVKGDAINLW